MNTAVPLLTGSTLFFFFLFFLLFFFFYPDPKTCLLECSEIPAFKSRSFRIMLFCTAELLCLKPHGQPTENQLY